MNDVSIIINGVRYDIVKANTEFVCEECHLLNLCEQHICPCDIFNIEEDECFKKSDKKFEK